MELLLLNYFQITIPDIFWGLDHEARGWLGSYRREIQEAVWT